VLSLYHCTCKLHRHNCTLHMTALRRSFSHSEIVGVGEPTSTIRLAHYAMGITRALVLATKTGSTQVGHSATRTKLSLGTKRSSTIFTEQPCGPRIASASGNSSVESLTLDP